MFSALKTLGYLGHNEDVLAWAEVCYLSEQQVSLEGLDMLPNVWLHIMIYSMMKQTSDCKKGGCLLYS